MYDRNAYVDQLNIETPEQVDLHFPIAGIGSRFIAILVDSLLQVAAYIVLGILVYVTSSSGAFDHKGGQTSDTATKWIVALFILLNFLMFWGYFVLFETFWKGQTPGKRVMKLRVLKDSGRSITLFEAMARNLLRVVDLLPNFYLIGLIAMLCNRQHQRLGDLVAGTIVVHERSDEQPLLTHNSRTFTASIYTQSEVEQGLMPKAREEWAASEAELPDDAVTALNSTDLHLIESFFSRALDLSVETRARLAAQVAARISERMGRPIPEGMPPERILELIAYRMRSQAR